MKRKTLIILILFVCVFQSSTVFSQILRIGFIKTPQTLNPIIGLTNTSMYISDLLFNSMYGIRVNTAGKPELFPELAESIPKSSGVNAYKVKLRPNVRWHNGTPVTSSDVVATVKSIQRNSDHSAIATRVSKIQDVVPVDQKTVKVIFKSQVGPTEAMDILNFKIIPLSCLYNFFIPPNQLLQILNKTVDYRMTTSDLFSLSPFGTGPFRMKEGHSFNPDGSSPLVLERNEEYFLGTPEIHSIQIKFYSDAPALLGDILSANRHVIINPPSELLPKLNANRNYKLHSGDYNEMVYIGYNFNRFGSQKPARSALSSYTGEMMVEWIQGIHGQAQKAVQGIVKRTYGPATLNHYQTYGIPLTRVGLAAGGDLAILHGQELSVLYKSYSREQSILATYLKDALNYKDINVLLQPEGINDYYKAIRNSRTYDFVIYRVRPSNDLGRYFNDGWKTNAPFNVTNYTNDQVDNVLNSLANYQRGVDKVMTMCKSVYDKIVNDYAGTWLWSYKDVIYVNTILDIKTKHANFFRPFGNIHKWSLKDKN